MKKLHLLTQLLLLLAATAFSQAGESIHFDQIAPKKVRSLLKKEQLQSKADFDNMQPSCYEAPEQSGYCHHASRIAFDEPVEVVWEVYRTLNPKELGGGKIITFGVSYSRKHQKLIYSGDACEKIEEGQIIISGLRYLGGFVKIAVAQEITEINEGERYITFCYMKNGKTLGSQQIMFQGTEEGGTVMTHETFYQSKSKFRDKKLYPGLHEKTILEMHANVRLKMEARMAGMPRQSEVEP